MNHPPQVRIELPSLLLPYTESGYPPALIPRIALTLSLNDRSVDVVGLVDSGATVNLLPYSIGLELGAVYQAQRLLPPLSGSVASTEIRALRVAALLPQLDPQNSVPLVFAWAKSDDVPILLGQMNFFLEFNICFFRADQTFEITRR
jgi:hypothetical protein